MYPLKPAAVYVEEGLRQGDGGEADSDAGDIYGAQQ